MQRGPVKLRCRSPRPFLHARQGNIEVKHDEYAQIIAACYIVSTISKLKHKERVTAGHGHNCRRIFIEGHHRRKGKYNDACKGYVVGYEGSHGFYIGGAAGAFEVLMQEANRNTPDLLKPYGVRPHYRGW